jgi:DNA-binding transcriptional ArsR family regulator
VAEPESAAAVREIHDAQALRALTHPVRIALIEALSIHGPLTATEAGELIGESATTCSFHLRQLAKYGFVEEAGGGKGRARPWRMSFMGLQFSTASDNPEMLMASSALTRLVRERQLERYQAWLDTRGSYPGRWSEAAIETQLLLYLTAEELDAVNKELLDLLLPRVMDRLTDPTRRPRGALPIEMLLFAYPIALPTESG